MNRFPVFKLWVWGVLIINAAMAVAACSPDSAANIPLTANTEALNTSTPIAAAQAATAVITPTVAPTLEPTIAGPDEIVVWWPDVLAPIDNADVTALLNEQTEAFVASQDNVVVRTRLKTVSGVGGIMSTLRTGSVVAPGALPDLTLIRRENLMAAVQTGLVQPLEGEIATVILGNLYDSALQLGQVNGQLYGLPYTLEVEHVAYDPDVIEIGGWSYADVLGRDVPLIMPTGRTTGLNDVFLAQYLVAGGTLPQDGVGTVDAAALRDTLRFYEQAMEAGILPPEVLQYTAPSDYEAQLAAGEIDQAVVTSTMYLRLLADGHRLETGLIPTDFGEPGTVLNGWLWVMTTANSDRQVLALRYLNWMLDTERQSEFSAAIHMLPSQRPALLRWESVDYATFVSDLLNNAVLPVSESTGGAAIIAMQTALNAVLSGEMTADEAADDVIEQLADTG